MKTPRTGHAIAPADHPVVLLVTRLKRRFATALLGVVTLGVVHVSSAREPRVEATVHRDPSTSASHVSSRIVVDEYAFARGDDGTHRAVNRGQGFTARFDPTGVLALSSEGSPSPLATLSFEGLGRRGRMQARPVARTHLDTCRADGALDTRGLCMKRLDVVRAGGLVEWWENSAAGIEHGFTIARRPSGRGELELAMKLRGARIEMDEAVPDRATFRSPTGRSVEYSDLRAWDARGRALSTRLVRRDDRRLAIRVDDSGAHYPIVVDPILSASPDWTLAGVLGPGAHAGTSVASAGDVNGDGFDDVIVGVPDWRTVAGMVPVGRAHLFLGSASGLSTTASWTAVGDTDSRLGVSVSSAGDVNGDGFDDVIVGAPSYTHDAAREGRASLYLGGASGLSASPSWSNSDANQIDALFGHCVASAGDVNGDGFDDVIVGAPSLNNGHAGEGAFFVYLGSASGLSTTTSITRASGQAYAGLGWSVAGAGDVNGDGFDDVVAGAPNYENGETQEGFAFLFNGSASGIVPTSSWHVESGQAVAHAGTAVAGLGDLNDDGFDDVGVGTPDFDAAGTDDGRVQIFYGSATGLPLAASTTTVGWAGVRFGKALAHAGDVNGDGFDDVIIGAPFHSYPGPEAGSVIVWLGREVGFASFTWTTTINQEGASFGASVASAGDVNGDGYDDVIIGAPNAERSAATANEGAAFAYHGYPPTDMDGDGYAALADGGRDCNDADPGIHPGAVDSSCNGVDENCSGIPDDAFTPSGSTCGVGACMRTGTTSCTAGALEDSCTPGTAAPSDATCDGIDDDCSGTADEDGTCSVADAGMTSDAATATDATVVIDASTTDASGMTDPPKPRGGGCSAQRSHDVGASALWLTVAIAIVSFARRPRRTR